MTKPPIIFEYLKSMKEHKASDIYLTVGQPPTLRGDMGVTKLGDTDLVLDDLNEILNSVLTNRQKREYESSMELNTSLDMAKFGRFRVNVLRQRQMPALVIRRIVSEIPSFKELRLPPILSDLAMQKRGLVLVTGMTGSGKSTTLASMIDKRNSSKEGHIITIEDPIEYYHEHKMCVVSQREVGVDTESYAAAMKNSLRQRPDVILVGEIRDREVMEQALSIAETGHLCLATIHTNNTYQAIERVVNLFPEDYHNQIRLNLSMNLNAIISQRLLPSTKGGLVPAIELLLNQGLVRELILKGDISDIKEVIEQNAAIGMRSFDQCLLELYASGMIDEDTTIKNSDNEPDMRIKVQNLNLVGALQEEEDDSEETEPGASILNKVDTSLISFTD